jgi:ribosomal protein L40E
LIRGPFVYKGKNHAFCAVDGKPLEIGEEYYLATGYGSVSTFHARCIDSSLKAEATQKNEIICQGCGARIPYRKAPCPECSLEYGLQRGYMLLNLAENPERRLIVRNGKLRSAGNGNSKSRKTAEKIDRGD